MHQNKKTPNPRHTAAALALAATIALTTCDTPTAAGAGGPPSEAGGIGSITISLNTGSASNRAVRTAVPDSAELAGITLKVHLTGPGGTIDRDFGPDGGTIELASGAWDITVKAYNSEPRLRGIADQAITVSPGGSQTIAVTSAIGVKTEAELRDVLDANVGLFRYNDTDLSRENLIILEADVDLNDMLIISDTVYPNPRKYTIIAEPGTTRTIYRRDGSGLGAFISMDNGSLTLGRAGETGSLIIDGMGVAYTPGSAFLYIYTDPLLNTSASLIIDGNTEITRMNDNSNGAAIWCDSYVEMRSGKITNCTNTSDSGAVAVRQSGRFVMSGGEISGNTSSSGNGGGVLVTDTAAFTMSGGEISGNTAPTGFGGGVSLMDNATFTMSGGEISGNTAPTGRGGGVYVRDSATFTMNNGLISGNTTRGGGGVYVLATNSSTPSFFYMNGGEISGNISPAVNGGGVFLDGTSGAVAHFVLSNGEISGNNGGGVELNNGAIFEMSNGEISGNTATGSNGGGVNMYNNITFTMSGGKINDNTATGYGGGVHVEASSTFTMSGGEINRNLAFTSDGGGVSVVDVGGTSTFTMSGGEINDNTARGYSGGGVFVRGTSGGTSIFTMTDGLISGNSAQVGGGVGMRYNATAAMTGGEISGNRASYDGGGVHLDANTTSSATGSRTFNMSGGEISGNTATGSNGGCGVFLGSINAGLSDTNSFIMTDGLINNTNTSLGGDGVFIGRRGIFAKRGGSMTSTDSSVRIVNVFQGAHRISTAGPNDRLYIDNTNSPSVVIDPVDNVDTTTYWTATGTPF